MLRNIPVRMKMFIWVGLDAESHRNHPHKITSAANRKLPRSKQTTTAVETYEVRPGTLRFIPIVAMCVRDTFAIFWECKLGRLSHVETGSDRSWSASTADNCSSFLVVFWLSCDATMGVPFFLVVLSILVLPQQGMQKKVEQRANIKFLCAAGKTPIECWRSLQAVYGTDCLSKTQVWVWYRRFRGGDTDICDKARAGRPRTVCVPRTLR